jgi:hypothetical protein
MSFSWQCTLAQRLVTDAVLGLETCSRVRTAIEAVCPCDEHGALRELVLALQARPRTHREIGAVFGVTYARIQQIEAGALEKLRRALAREGHRTAEAFAP